MRSQIRCAEISAASPKLLKSVPRTRSRAFSIQKQSSLLSVPGIGKCALDRLQKASVDSVSELCDLYVQEHGRSKASLVQYLKVS